MQIHFKNMFLKNRQVFCLLHLSIRITLEIKKKNPDSTKFRLPPAKAKPTEGNHGQCLYKHRPAKSREILRNIEKSKT